MRHVKTVAGFLLTVLVLMSCAPEISTAQTGLCIYNALKTIPGIISLEAYGSDAGFIRYSYRVAKGQEDSSTLLIFDPSGTEPRG